MILGGILLFISLPYAIGIIVMATKPFGLAKYLEDFNNGFFQWLLGLNFIVWPILALLIVAGIIVAMINCAQWCKSEWRQAQEYEVDSI